VKLADIKVGHKYWIHEGVGAMRTWRECKVLSVWTADDVAVSFEPDNPDAPSVIVTSRQLREDEAG